MKAEHCPVVILAAGASVRLGRPKQLLQFQQQSFIKRLVSEAQQSTATVVVVTGSNHDQIITELQGEPIVVVENRGWAQGMGSSISKGMSELKNLVPDASAVILAVCDQPFVDAASFTALMELQKSSGKKIVACSYANTVGTPVLFDHTYFEALQQLKGTAGAKKVVQQFAEDVALLPFPQGAIDIDTQDDYEALLQQT